jgi:hypothetical protein
MASPIAIWNWSPPRPPWLVIGIVTTSGILILGGLLVATAITHNTRYEQLGFMLSLVLVLVVIAVMIQTLRRHVVRMRVQIHPDGLRWSNLNRGVARKMTWDDLIRFQIAPLHAQGRPIGTELRLWTRFEPAPLIIREEVNDVSRHERFEQFNRTMTEMLMKHQVERR